jgi:hypothetical protein
MKKVRCKTEDGQELQAITSENVFSFCQKCFGNTKNSKPSLDSNMLQMIIIYIAMTGKPTLVKMMIFKYNSCFIISDFKDALQMT